MAKSLKTPANKVADGKVSASKGFPVVGIGASAGGLEALELFLSHLALDCGLAIVVIQHLDPERKGMMPELLQRATKLPVVEAGERMTLAVNTVYVTPSNKYLSIVDGAIFLVAPPEPHGLRMPIDYFFRTLADERHDRAIGVILSGMGSDGTLGVAAIKQNAGLILVQDPATAKFDGMPRSAISAGLADIIAPADQLPQRIASYLGHIPIAPTKHGLTVVEPGQPEATALDQALVILRQHSGHDFSLYKKTTVSRRVERRMGIHQFEAMGAYVDYLKENPQEIELLFKELLIGVTSFFRDRESWNCLRQQVLLPMLSSSSSPRVLRAWVPGCSTGEEAYSLAIAFREALDEVQSPLRFSLQVFATDLDPDAVQRARQALYPADIAADLTPQRLARYFIDENGLYRVCKEIREMVVFAPQNLIMDPPFTKLDILCCRNLLIYLGAELQRRLLPLFHYSLNAGGVLFLGGAESVGTFSELFETIDGKARLFRRNNSRLTNVDFPSRFSPDASRPLEPASESEVVNLQALVERILLRDFAPASVLINGEGDILYISGRTGRYLESAAGKANWNIHAMAREGLREELLLSLRKALRDHERVTRCNLSIGDGPRFDLTLQPVDAARLPGRVVLVVFTEVSALTPDPRVSNTGRVGRPGGRVGELERALQQSLEEAQGVREEMQSSREELKSANEELQSTNEELQSTNEELTTSKEEMQSLNEELQTVNAELQSNVDELSAASNDMKNLLNSTDLATVFLDGALHVRRFTSQAMRIFKLIANDLGRPLSDIVMDLNYPNIEEDGREVLRTLAFCEKEVETGDGRWFMIKIMPYRTLANVIDGLVITFSDISVAKRLEARLRQGESS